MISDKEKQLKEKIESAGVQLKEWDMQINYGIKTGYNEAFIIDSKKREELISQDPKSAEIIKPILRGKDIGRYMTNWAELWVIATFPALNVNIANYPVVKEYLLSFGKQRLSQAGKKLADGSSSRKKTGNEWFETQDQIAYYPEFQKEKIVWGNLSITPRFGYDTGGLLCSAPANLLTGNNLKYILAILNSSLCYYIMRQLAYSREQGYMEYKKVFVEQITIPQIALAKQVPLIELVDTVLDLYARLPDINTPQDKALHQKRIDVLEAQIDRVVYGLYGLNEKEIGMVGK